MVLSELGKVYYQQEDGAVWRAFYDRNVDPDHNYLIVTSAGKHEFLHPPVGYRTLKKLFRAYRRAESGRGGHPSIRDFLGSGQQATVFGLSNRYAVREVVGNPHFYSALSDLTRMDKLSSVVEGGLPRWINVPPYYALYSDQQRGKQYTLMERIDSGLTVEDIVDFETVSDVSKTRAEAVLGRTPTERDVENILRLYNRAKVILDTVISAHGQNPEEYLTDWAMRNVLIEPVPTPIAGERMKLHIIDQN